MNDRKLNEFAINCDYRFIPVTMGGLDVGKHKFWTMVVHEPTCRFATNKSTYFGQGGLQRLAEHGFGAKAIHVNEAWLGCKVCGTANLTREEQRALGRQAVDAEEAKIRAYNRARHERYQVEDASRNRLDAIRAAREAWIKQHAVEVEAVEAAAAARWAADHPEQALLLVKEVSA